MYGSKRVVFTRKMKQHSVLIYIVSLYWCAGTGVPGEAKTIANLSGTKALVENVTRKDFSEKALQTASVRDGQTRSDGFIINNRVDHWLNEIAYAMLTEGHDPAPLTDREIKFEYKPLLITYHGKLTLTRGQLQGLSSINRTDDAMLLTSTKGFQLSIPIGVDILITSYHFKMAVKRDIVEGMVYAWKRDVKGISNLELAGGSVSAEELSLSVGSLTVEVYSTDISTQYKKLVKSLSTGLLNEIGTQYFSRIIGSHITAEVRKEFDLD